MKALPSLKIDLSPDLEKKIAAFCRKHKYGWAEIGDIVVSWRLATSDRIEALVDLRKTEELAELMAKENIRVFGGGG